MQAVYRRDRLSSRRSVEEIAEFTTQLRGFRCSSGSRRENGRAMSVFLLYVASTGDWSGRLLATWAATAAHDADDQAIMTQKRFFACIPRRLGAAAFT